MDKVKPALNESTGASYSGLEEQVRAALNSDIGIDASGVEVRTKDVSGAVTLTGSIPTLHQHQRAGECVASVEGVGIVHNHLRVVHEEDPTETHPPSRRKPQS